MKVAVVLGDNIHCAPYYYRYEKWLCDNAIDFDVIMWNRDGTEEKCQGKLMEFVMADQGNNKNPFKIYKFFAFASFAKKVIKGNNYDKIIFLGFTGCAVTLKSSFYKKRYKGQYWLDIRDYHYEWFKPYYRLEKRAIENAHFVAISSKGFESFLPEHEYGYIHNIDPNIDKICQSFVKSDSKKIRISFIGRVRYYDENIALINSLKNDSRFVLQYYGPGSEKIEEYCKKNNIENVEFAGAFESWKTGSFYEKTDVINNVYGNTAMETLTALSNKLYYSIYLKIPIMVSSGTYMEEICKPYDTAIAYRDEESFADNLYAWYNSYVAQDNAANYELLQHKVEQEDSEVQRRFVYFITNS